LTLSCDNGVHVTPVDGGSSKPPEDVSYLTYNDRVGSAATAAEYVATSGQEPTLEQFKNNRCLGDELSLEYFNFSDLALGRRLTFAKCKNGSGRITACVENGGVGGETSSDGFHALASKTDVAVCMDYSPERKPGFETQFYIYNSGAPETGLNFDLQGEKFLPFACTACHGGRYVDVDASTGNPVRQVKNGFFLPLLKESLIFKQEPAEETLRSMNMLIYEATSQTNKAPGISQLIDAAYPGNSPGEGVATPGKSYLLNAVPPSWTMSEQDTSRYAKLVHKYCIGCHASQIDGGFPINSPEQFAKLGSSIRRTVCEEASMPNALQTRQLLNGDETALKLAGCIGN
jgi:hypothetical protein